MSLTIEVPTTIMGIYDEEFEGPLTPLSSDDEDRDTRNRKDESAQVPVGSSIPQNLEEGEIFEEKATASKATLGRKKRRLLKKMNIRKRKELDRERAKYMQTVLSQIYGEKDIFVHRLTKSATYFQKICNLEVTTGSPVSVDDPEFPKEQTLWINEPGLHLGVDTEDASLICAVRVRPFHTIKPLQKAEIIDCLTTVMDWTTCVSDIKLNASQKKPHGNEASKPSKPTMERKRNGVMFGAGWHQSMEADKIIVYYAPKITKAAPEIYERCIDKFSRVARLYRDGLCSLFPGGARQINDDATENMIPSFATLALDGNSAEAPFANSLTITRDDFANYQHKDADKIQIAYGLWWPAALHKAGHHKQYVIDSNVGHDKVKGGAFLWGEYGMAVEFEKCDGLVEIYWRGKLDFHCTTASRSAANTTRFGTSVQLTGKGTAAVARYWASGGDVTQSTTPEDRLIAVAAALQERAQKTSEGKGKAR